MSLAQSLQDIVFHSVRGGHCAVVAPFFISVKNWFGNCSLAVAATDCLAKPRRSLGWACSLSLAENPTGGVPIFPHFAADILDEKALSNFF